MTVKEILDEAKSQVGVTEYPPNSNNVLYNTWFYGHEVSGKAFPWCCTYIVWLFRRAPQLVKRTASCLELYNFFKAKGQLVDKPQAGDIVFFHYNTNNRFTNHVGLVIGVSKDGKPIFTNEGNTSITSNDNGGAVMERTRTSNIVAYARPKYAGMAGGVAPTATLTDAELDKVARDVIALKYGCGNDRRQRLEAAGYDYKTVQARVNEIKRGGK